MATARYDFTAFDVPYDRAAASSLAAFYRATRPTSFKQGSTLTILDVISLVGFVPVFLFFLPFTITSLVGMTQLPLDDPNFGTGVFTTLTVSWLTFGSGAFIWYTVNRYVGRVRKYRDVETWWRLLRFSEANNLLFSPWTPGPSYPSRVFRSGEAVASYDHVRAQGEPFFDMGNLFTHTGQADAHTFDRRWGFLAIHLDRQLPQIVLDAKANGRVGYGNLPVVPDTAQTLSLEGDFDDYFTLYAPRHAERDALFIFTPDLMALFIDEVTTLDAEIIDDWLFVYSTEPFDMRRRDVVERLFRIVELVGTKTRDRAERFVRSESSRSSPARPFAQRTLTLRQRYPRAVFIGVLVAFFAGSGLIAAIAAAAAGV